jgi:hypothetical protein
MRTLINKSNTGLSKTSWVLSLISTIQAKTNTMRTLINKYNISLNKTPCVLSLISTIQAKAKRHAYSH